MSRLSSAVAVEFVIQGITEHIEPMAYRFLPSFASENALCVRDGRVAERTLLAQLERGGGDAAGAALSPAT